MDLHDFEDVAMNYDNYLSVMCTNEVTFDGFLEFYSKLATQYGSGGIIDIACGTGAVLLYLAERGFDVCGTDLSEAMVKVASKKARNIGLYLNVFAANMTEFTCDKQFSLAIIARSGFMHLTTSELQRQALLNIRKHLLPGGILTLNTFAPDVRIQYNQVNTSVDDYTLRLEYTNTEGKPERLYNAITYDPITQQMYGNWKFDTLDDLGNVTETRIRPLHMRQTYKQELLYLIELCGYEVVSVYGDYYFTPESNGNLIWVLRKTK